MRIALTADPGLPVPPRLYGGIERVIDLLAKGLEARGHDVTLFAHRDSASAGRLIPWPSGSGPSPSGAARNAATLASEVMRGHFDLVHSFSRIAYLAPILPLDVPKLMTFQRAITSRTVALGHALSRGTLEFSAISRWMMRKVAHIGRWTMIPNGVSLDTYVFRPRVAIDAPLVFLGRLEAIKGPHVAIEIARAAGIPLVMAGNVPDGHRAWFDEHVAPHVDNREIRYVGPVDDHEKNRLLGAARALLMPILWEEPFGIVMAEAMACGTPVLGFNRGAVPEVVADGVTGFVCKDVDGLVKAAGRLGEIDRVACRARAQALYSAEAVVDGYLAVYDRMMSACRA